jgi:hypothetical protein
MLNSFCCIKSALKIWNLVSRTFPALWPLIRKLSPFFANLLKTNKESKIPNFLALSFVISNFFTGVPSMSIAVMLVCVLY